MTSTNPTRRPPRIEQEETGSLEPARWPARPDMQGGDGRAGRPNGARVEVARGVPAEAESVLLVTPRLQAQAAARLLNALALYAVPLLVVLAVFAAGYAGAVRER